MSNSSDLDSTILNYLALPDDYQPRPSTDPIAFLQSNLRLLPPNLLHLFSSSTSPTQRASLPLIRNRRLAYAHSNPSIFHFDSARNTWPYLWQGNYDPGSIRKQQADENADERKWAESSFLDGRKQHVGKLGGLLGMSISLISSATHPFGDLLSTVD